MVGAQDPFYFKRLRVDGAPLFLSKGLLVFCLCRFLVDIRRPMGVSVFETRRSRKGEAMKKVFRSTVLCPLSLVLFFGCSSGVKPVSKGGEGGGALSGTIEISPKLAKKIAPNAIIFVMAKPQLEGPPLAVKRLPVSVFPVSFELTGADVMVPNVPLAGEFFIIVRIDKDGMAGPAQKGDMEGKTKKPVPVGHPSVPVRIDKVY